MNNARRAEILGVIHQLEDLRDKLEYIKSDEEDYQENIPENLIGSDKFNESVKWVVWLEDAVSDLDFTIEGLEQAG